MRGLSCLLLMVALIATLFAPPPVQAQEENNYDIARIEFVSAKNVVAGAKPVAKVAAKEIAPEVADLIVPVETIAEVFAVRLQKSEAGKPVLIVVTQPKKGGDPVSFVVQVDSDCSVNSSGYVQPPPPLAQKKVVESVLIALTRHRHDGKNDDPSIAIAKNQHKAKLERIDLGPADVYANSSVKGHAWEVVLASVK